MLDALLTAGEPGCSAAVGVEGTVVWRGVQGLADLKSGAKITPETVFDIASVSKQFTATAILLLAHSGKLGLDDPLSDHVRGLPAWSTKVTMKQLMHHTSGIPDYLQLLADKGHRDTDLTTRKQAMRSLTTAKLRFRPGSEWEYSNSNYLLLAEVVENVTGDPLPRYVKDTIFRPLALDMVMDPRAAIPKKAVSYRPDQSLNFLVADAPYEQVGDAGVQTTPAELVRWADNYRTGKVGGARLISAVLAGAVDTQHSDGVHYGAGIGELPDKSLVHEGGLAGFLTTFWISKDRKTSVAISCNRDQIDLLAMRETISDIWLPQ